MEFTDFYNIIRKSRVTSTNYEAKLLAQNGEKEGTVVVADSQTAGRGRMSRSCYSPSGTGIYMSIILRPKLSPNKSLLITTAAAVAVCRAIERTLSLEPQIKWVNDIFLNGKKVCGILTEASLSTVSQTLEYAILGIGINLAPPKDNFPTEISSIATSLLNECDEDCKQKIINSVLEEFYELYQDLENTQILKEYRHRSLLDGMAITVHKSAEQYDATCVGVDDDFALIVERNGINERLNTGEVSIRMRDNNENQ